MDKVTEAYIRAVNARLLALEQRYAMDAETQRKANAFDGILPDLNALHDVALRRGCPAGERLIIWAIGEIERLADAIENRRNSAN